MAPDNSYNENMRVNCGMNTLKAYRKEKFILDKTAHSIKNTLILN